MTEPQPRQTSAWVAFKEGLVQPGVISLLVTYLVTMTLAVVSFYHSFEGQVPTRYVMLKENQRGEHTIREINGQRVEFRTSTQGYVLPSAMIPDPDLRIAFFGGSNTESSKLPTRDRWPVLAVWQLGDKTSKKIDLLNDGHAGCTARDAVQLLYNKVLFHEPDILVVHLGYNDLVETVVAGAVYPKITEGLDITPGTLYRTLLRGFDLGQDLMPAAPAISRQGSTGRTAHKLYDIDPAELDKPTQEFEDDLRLFASLAAIKNKPVFLLTLPSGYGEKMRNDPRVTLASIRRKDGAISFESMDMAVARFNEVIFKVCAEEPGVHLIDTTSLPADSDHLMDEVHYTSRGSRWIADRVADALYEYLLAHPELLRKSVP